MKSSVRTWLIAVYVMVFTMVLIGGITRLTGSGLSMVEWRPLMGALPPLSEAEWVRVFERYQLSPQYAQVNSWMELADFQKIFFWEYLHRLWGRLIGLVFFLPWVYFMARKRLSGAWARRTFIAFVLGGSQGLLGWFMVKSGLVDMPHVSHLRLAAHLSLAFFVGHYVLWLIYDLTWPDRGSKSKEPSAPSTRLTWAFIAVLSLQIVYGAFMAGTRAGFISSTWPDINGSMLPSEMGAMSPIAIDLIENLFTIHFIHRTLGYVVFALGLYLWRQSISGAKNQVQRQAGRLLAAICLTQVLLGIATVMMHVPTWVATLHQGGAYLLLTAAVALLHGASTTPAPALAPSR